MTNKCAFRLDDITPDMDWNRFLRVKAIFEKYGVKPLIGVVPDNRDKGLKREAARADFEEIVRTLQEEGWSIAQHGYQHVYETCDSGILKIKNASEFAGLPYEAQYEKLEKGREILQKMGLHVKIFMAPGHTYDQNTLRALKQLGFEYVTDGYANAAYQYKGLCFIPSRNARCKVEKGIDTICLHCNDMEDADYRELEGFLEHKRSAVVDYSELLKLEPVKKRGIGLALQERKNLFLLKQKKKVAESKKLQKYLQETYDENPAKKRWKRITGIWRLL